MGLLSRTDHRTPNFRNPEFQFPQFKVLQSIFFLFNIASYICIFGVYFDINSKLLSRKNTQKVRTQNIWDS